MQLVVGAVKLTAFMLATAVVATFVATAHSPPPMRSDSRTLRSMAEATDSIDATFKGCSRYDAKGLKTIRSDAGITLPSSLDGSVGAPG